MGQGTSYSCAVRYSLYQPWDADRKMVMRGRGMTFSRQGHKCVRYVMLRRGG